MNLRERLGKPKERMEFKKGQPVSGQGAMDLFSKVLRDPSPLHPGTVDKIHKSKVVEAPHDPALNKVKPRSSVAVMRSALQVKYAKVFEEMTVKETEGCTFKPNMNSTKRFNKSLSPGRKPKMTAEEKDEQTYRRQEEWLAKKARKLEEEKRKKDQHDTEELTF